MAGGQAVGINIQGTESDVVEVIVSTVLDVLASRSDEATKQVALNVLGTLSTKLQPQNISIMNNTIKGMEVPGVGPQPAELVDKEEEELDEDGFSL